MDRKVWLRDTEMYLFIWCFIQGLGMLVAHEKRVSRPQLFIFSIVDQPSGEWSELEGG